MAMFGREMGGSRPGSAGVASQQQENIDRRERLRQLALEKIDLDKDPYFMKNHLGSYECKLCLTLHQNEGSYLAHTQGKRHQQNLARRAAKEAKERGEVLPLPGVPIPSLASRKPIPRKIVKIGRPGYRVTKQKDPLSQQKSLLFEIEYPEIQQGTKPRHRFMSAFEQHVETPDKKYQYLLFAADPYDTIAFKIPNKEVERDPSTLGGPPVAVDPRQASKYLLSHWDKDRKIYTLQVHFRLDSMMPPPTSMPPPALNAVRKMN
ncbi:splicing factor 3A subunit 2 [Pelomyxa schiedti]|nr:splicing factor 3A subunit 2 [Pelomyxa schiedti]